MTARVIHQWADWVDPRYPVTGQPINWSIIDTFVVHYTAADDLIDGDPGEHAEDLPAYLRAIQRSYVTSRGYSVGYNEAVDWLGGIWTLRGPTIRCAANRDHNDHTYAMLCLVDGADPLTAEALAAVNDRLAWACSKAGRQLIVKGHDELTGPHHPTACPGAGILQQRRNGLFVPRSFDDQPTPPDPTPDPVPSPEEDDEMIRFHLVCKTGGVPEGLYLADGAGATFIGFADGADVAPVLAATGTPARLEVSRAQYDEFVSVARVGDGSPR